MFDESVKAAVNPLKYLSTGHLPFLKLGDLEKPSIKTFNIMSNIIFECLGFCLITCLTKNFCR